MPSMAWVDPLGLAGESIVALPSASTYWNAICPFLWSVSASSSLAMNFPSPWEAAMVCNSPSPKPLEPGEATVPTRVVTIWENVAVDVVVEQSWGILAELADFAEGQQAGFYKGLESIADSQNQTSARLKTLYCCLHLLVLDYAGDELAASVGFVALGEASGEGEYVAGVDMGGHIGRGFLDVLRQKVAEDGSRDLSTFGGEGFGHVVVAVCAGENGEINHRVLLGLTSIGGAAPAETALRAEPFTPLRSG